ncbi:MAG: hypothetical protein ABI158_07930 [Edaphobacter sp.]
MIADSRTVIDGVRNSYLIRLFLGRAASPPEIPTQTMRKIWELSLREVDEFEEMLDRDLSQWKLPPSLS